MRMLAIVAATLVLYPTGATGQMHLRHIGRYNTHDMTYRDHLMGVEQVGEHHALIASHIDLVLVDLETLPAEGTLEYLVRCEGIDVTNTVTIDDTIVYANLRLGGMAILSLSLEPPALQLIDIVEEPDVFFERLCVDGDRLYMAAHGSGLRIYDISNPWVPTPIGALQTGLVDTHAVAVDGNLAYVADGAAGLKIVDIADPSNPTLLAGETLETAVGTSSDLLVIDGTVYVAAGGAGVCAYLGGEISARAIINTPVSAKQIVRMGSRLVVADLGGVEVLDLDPTGLPAPLTRESGQRRSGGVADVTLRLWHGVGAWGTNRVLAANWDSVDVYELAESSEQADITPSSQRLRFPPGGGEKVVVLRSGGGMPLEINDVTVSAPGFSASVAQTVVMPGESTALTVNYVGGAPGEALVMVHTNDPDESPLPIQVYGDTLHLDPGEMATPFTVTSWTMDHEDGAFDVGTFSLDDHIGRIVYFHVFGLW
ncbi:MAG: LVIVD repeat-containing protein [Planctomycetota bacterium]